MIRIVPFPPEAAAVPLVSNVSRWTQPHETRLICHIARQVEGDILEIGCNNGLTSLELASTFPTRKVYAVDFIGTKRTMAPEQEYEKPFTEFGKWCKGCANVELLNQDSRTLNYAEQFPGARFIFIDGDHSYAGCKADTEKAIAFLRSVGGGLIAWHDYYADAPKWCQVKQYLDSEVDGVVEDMQHYEATWLVTGWVR